MHTRVRHSAGLLAAGAAIGLLVAAGWFATGYLGDDDFSPAPVASLTFVAPVADTLQYAMLSTGLSLSFGIVLVAGIVIGSLITSLVTRRFRLEGFVSARHMLRSLTGAALMGVGGAMAYGCTVGQGLTGVSTLALPSFIAVVGYMGGTAARPARRAARAARWRRPSRCSLHGLRHDADLRRQRAVHRTFVGDLEQLLALFVVECALDRDLAVDLVEPAFPGFTLRAVLGVNLGVFQRTATRSSGSDLRSA